MSDPTSGAFKASSLPVDAIELGRFQEAWGLKGWLHILPHSADTEALFASTEWFLQPPEARFARGFSAFSGSVTVKVAEIKVHADGVVARIEGVDDRNAAEALKGVRIYVPRSAFPATPDGEYYWVDLIGLDVVNREGVHMGIVRDLLTTGPNSVLVLEYTETVDGAARSAERMIPFVSAYVDSVDQSTRRITVDWQLDY
ncbi:MAG: ribosome maturation factor RimM [Hydrogenophaga sp.]|uniref:ribosome maturation factor RimM n=1 Tax=Hydrogenophaga sp. TaxID=1904254 RepID=UPI001BB94B95|nr:ribosome maturation factor RimM [Hydrogenophaga sp.]MBS3912520.1 ribosome maturation factor RimM [Hydrogenophaga sp.]MDO9147442.1 ribosome maturation factor RimM [Hydrogenophaga sp.]MDO9605778.1 ribosome maturation factor RimM [Hydrogenophaga sp.]